MTVFRLRFLGLLLALAPVAVLAADPVPVIEIAPGPGQSYSSGGSGQSFGTQEAQLMMMLQQLQDEVRSLRGQVESQQYAFDRMQKDQLERYRDLDRRMGALITGAAAAPVVPELNSDAALPDAAAPGPEGAPIAPAYNAPSASAGSGGDDQAYQDAFALVRERKFNEAAGAFERFVQDYPASARLANAHYWLGEIYLAQQQLDLAQTAFSRVVDDFPGSTKLPDALYKLGVLNYQRGNTAESARYLERVIRDFPQSSAARLAQNFKR
ncbi:tol-pal system protein YbgF [Marinobacterium aestuarii]|uniref:Cell division coordinator CpoB n=1 Tax=Marinobacterium aestuarii TaxID=1821621 RepID=A0A1A9EXP4_9GAMM|nr:tol-pal system protein YbgF [Marinobacterium aestuarii]ANG62401.1 tol-pal system protein YbgF [Marinobacterium aestuarii]